jgi:hypothetical protein
MLRCVQRLCLLALLLSAAPLPAAGPDNGFFFRKGDRVMFLGDSITMLWTL